MRAHPCINRPRRHVLPLARTLAACPFTPVQAASLHVTVLDKDGKPTPDAVVTVLPAAGGVAKNTPPLRAVIGQEKMQFVPVVTVVSRGAVVRFVNGDPWDHHVRLEGKTEGKPAKAMEVALNQSGATGATLFGCHIHGSMTGQIFVAESPWAVKTGPDGVAILEDVPEGAATVRVWHSVQLLEPTPQKVFVCGATGSLTFQLDIVPRRRRVIPAPSVCPGQAAPHSRDCLHQMRPVGGGGVGLRPKLQQVCHLAVNHGEKRQGAGSLYAIRHRDVGHRLGL